MSDPYSIIRPNTYLFLRLPSEVLRLVEIKLNTTIEVGKYGSFLSNLLIGRPYNCTYEILDKKDGEAYSRLRIVPPAELYAELELHDDSTALGEDALPATDLPPGFELVADGELVTLKNNRLTVDDASRQTLSQEEIEELKRSAGGKEIIEKILASHKGLDEKTAFARAKYTLRKHRKYLKRFTALPVDIGSLLEFITVKDAPRIMDLREETLGLITAWSNAHFSEAVSETADDKPGRWLVVDDTGGLVVATLAERLGILHNQPADVGLSAQVTPTVTEAQVDDTNANGEATSVNGETTEEVKHTRLHRDFPLPAKTNTITILHPAVQPNLSLLKYFGYDTSIPQPSDPESEHPLHTHLKSLSWLQLLHPEEDPLCQPPDTVTEDILAGWKSGKRGAYYKKRRRWERTQAIIEDTQDGVFESLIIATYMDLIGILQHTVPLIRGGGHIVIFSPTVEPLVAVMDLFSKERRTAYINLVSKGEEPDHEDFPLDPRMILAPSLQTSRVRESQVLPGRTHPLMTARGGAEGYIFTARKVIPLAGGVEARGNFGKKKKIVDDRSYA